MTHQRERWAGIQLSGESKYSDISSRDLLLLLLQIMIMIQAYTYVKDKSHTEVLAVAPWNVVGISSCKSFSEKEWFKSGSAIVFPDELTSAYKKVHPRAVLQQEMYRMSHTYSSSFGLILIANLISTINQLNTERSRV